MEQKNELTGNELQKVNGGVNSDGPELYDVRCAQCGTSHYTDQSKEGAEGAMRAFFQGKPCCVCSCVSYVVAPHRN